MYMFCNKNLISVVERLSDLIPMKGSVTNSKLKQYGVAQNVAYNNINNRLMNKVRNIRALGLCKYDLPFPEYYRGEC